jgi:hypothetical protein
MRNPDLEALRSGIPAARSLPLLCILARGAEDTIAIEYSDATHVQISVSPIGIRAGGMEAR